MLLCHFFHSQFLGGRKKNLDTGPLFLFSTDAYLFNLKHLNFWSLPLLHHTFSLIALRPMAICKFCFTNFLTLYCSSSWALVLTWASIFCLALLILLSFWVILFIHFSYHLLTHNSYLYFSFSPGIYFWLSPTHFVCMPATRVYEAHVQITARHFFFLL